jgi:hypothetical protein
MGVMSQLSSCTVSEARYELRFTRLSTGLNYAFPCDAGGQVDIGALSERTRNNYFFARAVIGREVSVPSIALVA